MENSIAVHQLLKIQKASLLNFPFNEHLRLNTEMQLSPLYLVHLAGKNALLITGVLDAVCV